MLKAGYFPHSNDVDNLEIPAQREHLMQSNHKLERANRQSKCSAETLKYASDYYHSGKGKMSQKKYFASLSPDKKRARAERTNDWKRRHKDRMSLLRWASNCKARVRKKNPGVASISAWEFIGCNVVELQAHVEGMFREGIGWHNRNEWEIDHIRPLCEFDLTDIEQVKQCLHYSNVQILITGPHLDKAKQESRAFMDKLVREYWQERGIGEYPGFSKAWYEFTKFRALRRKL